MIEPAGQKTTYSKAEYLAMEATAQYKSEYYQGEIFAMSGGSQKHSVICVNIGGSLWEATRNKDCVTFDSNMKLEIAQADAYIYPDAMVVCGDVVPSKDTSHAITNPTLVVEVLSPSTEAFDRGKKFEYYRSIPSLQEYVLVSQDEPKIETFVKQAETVWQYTVIQGIDQTVAFHSIGHETPMAEIYLKTDRL